MRRAVLSISTALFVAAMVLPVTGVHLPASATAYTETALDKKQLFQVTSVIDGDTIKVNVRGKIEKVRLLGIDTPETVDPRKPVQCFGKAASDKMKSFVSGQSVKLAADSTQGDRDKYGRLLRYVYLNNPQASFVNGELVKQGYAFSYRQYPTKMLAKFNGFETYARVHHLGLWGSCPLTAAPTKTTVQAQTMSKTKPAPTRTPAAPLQSTTTNAANGGLTCAGKTTCGQMASCAEAEFYLQACGANSLDGERDGVPCESLCK